MQALRVALVAVVVILLAPSVVGTSFAVLLGGGGGSFETSRVCSTPAVVELAMAERAPGLYFVAVGAETTSPRTAGACTAYNQAAEFECRDDPTRGGFSCSATGIDFSLAPDGTLVYTDVTQGMPRVILATLRVEQL